MKTKKLSKTAQIIGLIIFLMVIVTIGGYHFDSVKNKHKDDARVISNESAFETLSEIRNDTNSVVLKKDSSENNFKD